MVSDTPTGAEPVFSRCQRGAGKLARQWRKDTCRRAGVGIVGATRRRLMLAALMLLGALAATAASDESSYFGNVACAGCHEQATTDWADSHHDLAMQEATP